MSVERHIGVVTRLCLDALAPRMGDQHTVAVVAPEGPFAFEFWWPGHGVEGAVLLKVVVSDASEVGVENMVYPPLGRFR